MNLPDFLLQHLAQWAVVFPQKRSLNRAITVAFGILCGVGKRTITRAIGFHGNTQKDWSADYKLFSRSPWEPRELFNPILETAIQEQKLKRIVLSVDDTRVWRNGKKVPQTQWHRDPLGPAFQTNLRWGHRFLQGSLVLPLYKGETPTSSRAIPVRWEMAPVVKKPGKNAEKAQLQEYEREKKEKNLSHQFVALGKELRGHLNQSGHADKSLSLVVDASFSNRTVFAHDWEKDKVTIVGGLRSITVMRRKSSEWERLRCGTRSRSLKCLRSWWPCIVGCSWRVWLVMAPRGLRSMRFCPSGERGLNDPRVWTW